MVWMCKVCEYGEGNYSEDADNNYEDNEDNNDENVMIMIRIIKGDVVQINTMRQ